MGEDEDEDEGAADEEEQEEEDEQDDAQEEERSAPARKKQKGASSAAANGDAKEDISVPRLSRKAAKVANASVAIEKTFEAGKKFNKIRSDGPSALYASLLAARSEKGGVSKAYPGTETLASFRVSNNDLFGLGDKEDGKKIDKGKKKTKEEHQGTAVAAGAANAATVSLPPQHRLPTLRTTPSGHTIVEVHRTEAIQAARMLLPVCSQEQEVMECVAENDVCILSGETGSGSVSFARDCCTCNARTLQHVLCHFCCSLFFWNNGLLLFCVLSAKPPSSPNFCSKPATVCWRAASPA
jgi:HrpA-like RNA helicase